MNKKIIAGLLFFALMINLPATAAFKVNVSKNDRINPSQKLEYVNLDYFSQFGDDYLQNYILKAVESNHDARTASFKTMEYRENVKMALAAQLPSLNVGVDYLGLKTPDNIGGNISKNNLAMPFIASWEPDLFLKNNDKRKSAKKSYEASIENEKGVYIALSGDVASLYFNLLNLDKQIEITQNIVENQNEIYERSKKSYRQGALPLLDLNKQEQALKNVKALNEELLKSRDTVSGQFRLLIGEAPGFEITRGKLDVFELKNKIPQEISGEVINQRPDVISAQRQLERAGIDVRVARKEFLPKINLTGILGFSTMSGGGFFAWENALGAILAGATQDIFTGGKKVANLKIKKFQYEQTLEQYKQTDLNALKEVNDALLIAKHDYKIYETVSEDNEIEVKNFKITQNKNRCGAIGKIEVLNQQNALLNSNKNLANKKTESLVDLITLYKAAGGKI